MKKLLLTILLISTILIFNFNSLFAQSPIVFSSVPERCVNGNTLYLNNYVSPLGGIWSSLSSGLIQPDSFIPGLAGAGTHWVIYTYTDTSGTYTDSSTIIINPIPIASIQIADSNCGDYWFFAQAIVGTGPSYKWQCNDPIENFYGTGNSFNHKFTSPGSYPFTMIMTAKQCSTIYMDTINVLFFKIFLPNDTDICYGSNFTVNSTYINNSGPVSYQWNTTANDTLQAISLSLVQDTTLRMTASDTLGCSSIDTIYINMHNFPLVDIGEDIRICNYSFSTIIAQIILDESTMDSIIWIDEATGIELSYDTLKTFSDSGMFICKVVDTIGCIGYDSLEVVESPDITAFAPGNTLCYGEQAILNAIATGGGGADYYWYENGGLLGAARQITVTLLQTTDYELIVVETIDSVTCSDTGITRIRVNPLPEITISTIPERCYNGQTLQLNNYVIPYGGTWSSTSTGLILPDNFIPMAAGLGQHWVKYRYIDPVTFCVNRDSGIVTINALPRPDAGEDDLICSTSGIYDLYNKENPQTPPGDWRGTAVYGSKYTWYFDPADPAIVDGGVYPLIYNYTDNNGCTNEDTFVMTVKYEPRLQISTSFIDLCTGRPYSFKGNHKYADQILWFVRDSLADGSFVGDVTQAIIKYNPGLEDMSRYYFWLYMKASTTGDVCEPTYDSLKVSIFDIPFANFYAEGNIPLIVRFYDSTTIGFGSISKYEWDFGDGNTSLEQNPTHNYIYPDLYQIELSVTSDAGCKDYISKEITLSDKWSLGVLEAKASTKLSIKPNPADNQAIISINNNNFQIKSVYLYNSFGQLVSDYQSINKSQLIIKRNNLPGGIYFLRVILNTGNAIFDKLIFE